MNETWINISDLPYQVSSLGRIRSTTHAKKRILNPGIRNGYLYIILTKSKKKTVFQVNRLVALHFILNPKNKPYVNHINGVKTDNRVENLEWVTPKENSEHAVSHGLWISQLSEKQVKEIRENYDWNKHSFKEIAEKYGVCKSYIWKIVNNKARLTF